MAKLTILYGHPEDQEAFEDYYANRHLPFAAQTMPGVQRADLARVTATPDGRQPPYYRIAEMHWADLDALHAALNSPAGQSVLHGNFVTGEATLLICDSEEPT